MKLFRKNIDPSCAYCRHGERVSDTMVLCMKKGSVSPDDRCRSFRYDPLKRVPPRPVGLDTDRLEEKDFSLD